MSKIQRILNLFENSSVKKLTDEFKKTVSVDPKELDIYDVENIIMDYADTTLEGVKLDSDFYLGELEFAILLPDTYGDYDGDYDDWEESSYSWEFISISNEDERDKFVVKYVESGYRPSGSRKPDKVLKVDREGLENILQKLRLYVKNAKIKSIELN